jgi:hypothetical protein
MANSLKLEIENEIEQSFNRSCLFCPKPSCIFWDILPNAISRVEAMKAAVVQSMKKTCIAQVW